MRRLLPAAVFTLVVLLEACTWRKEDLVVPFPPGCDTTGLQYSTGAIQQIVTTKCAISGCHVGGTSAGWNFNNYPELKAVVDAGALKDRVFVKKDMPKTGSLDACQYAQLQAWVNAGAPQ